MRWVLAIIFLVSMVGAPPAEAGNGDADCPAVPLILAPADGTPATPQPPPSSEQPSPDDELALACPSPLAHPDGAHARRPDATNMPAGTDRSVPRPPPDR